LTLFGIMSEFILPVSFSSFSLLRILLLWSSQFSHYFHFLPVHE
jgi:hypothetical protein